MGQAVAVADGVAGQQRLELARSVLRKAERTRPAPPVAPPGDDGRMLPVAPPLRAVLPAQGLRRGSVVAVRGSTSLLLTLIAKASANGSWSALVGRPDLGLAAAAEAGLDLARLALIPHPGAELVGVTAALLDGIDLVVVADVEPLRAGDRQRLAARARGRGSVLLPLGRWPGADVELRCTGRRWHGLVRGAGRLRSRTVRVEVRGRGVAARGRSAELVLPPSPAGLSVEPDATADTDRWNQTQPVRVAG
jgi:hypothetical protein